jgi:hypothetical protein
MASISAMAFSQELKGEWTADFDGMHRTKARTVYEFYVDGSKLTGSVLGGSLEEEMPIINGKIKGSKISFALQEYYGNRAASYLYEGKISGDTINFTVTFGGRTISKFTARKLNQ